MQRIGRLSLAFLGLVILPWTIFGATYLAWRFAASSIPYNQADAIEIQSISYALKAYRLRYGEYPPDFSTDDPKAEIDEHLERLFPNRDVEVDSLDSYSHLGPHNALHFWLQGFSEYPETPLKGRDRGLDPLFKFDATRLIGQNYYPMDGQAPIVYFRGGPARYAKAKSKLPRWCGFIRPYQVREKGSKTSGSLSYAADDSFQVICAGKDGNFGSANSTLTSAFLGAGADNLTSFSPSPMGNQLLAERRESLKWTCALSFCSAILGVTSYPLVYYLRQRRDGTTQLRQLIRKTTEREMSEAWSKTLAVEKTKQRTHAIERMARRCNSKTSKQRTS